MHELISNRGASTKIRTAPRARDAEVSGDESGGALSLGLRVEPAVAPRRRRRDGDASGSDASSQTPLDLADRESLLYKVDLFSAPCH